MSHYESHTSISVRRDCHFGRGRCRGLGRGCLLLYAWCGHGTVCMVQDPLIGAGSGVSNLSVVDSPQSDVSPSLASDSSSMTKYEGNSGEPCCVPLSHTTRAPLRRNRKERHTCPAPNRLLVFFCGRPPHRAASTSSAPCVYRIPGRSCCGRVATCPFVSRARSCGSCRPRWAASARCLPQSRTGSPTAPFAGVRLRSGRGSLCVDGP